LAIGQNAVVIVRYFVIHRFVATSDNP
jgi:hypothetical protein